MKKKNVRVTENVFYLVKLKLCNCSTYNDIYKDVGISKSTCALIKRSATYNDYKLLVARAGKQKPADQKATQTTENASGTVQSEKPHIVEHRQNVTIQATHYMMTELQQANELLKGISAKLAFIVEELS